MIPPATPLSLAERAAIDAVAAGLLPCADSRRASSGQVFLAFGGERSDGRAHIAQAIAAGCSAVLWEAEGFSWPEDWQLPNLAVAGLRQRAGLVAAHLLGEPARQLAMVGVTGTNGKTSCAHWLTQAFGLLGQRTALIGTVGYGFLDALQTASHTTPDAVSLQRLLADFRQQGAQRVCMEASSHALSLGRVEGVPFRSAIFTNLTRDHLDFHGDMASYGEAKASLFLRPELRHAVINIDDPFGAALYARLPAGLRLGYGLETGELRGERLRQSLDGLRIDVVSPWGRGELKSPLIGRFNAYNLLACLGVLLREGVDFDAALAVLGRIQSASGRMDRLGGNGQPLVLVDYAHTPDALDKALSTLREILPPGGRLLCVFGCGGDRDRGKRPQMGQIARELADLAIVTSDNPRTEAPQAIIDDILPGLAGPGRASHLVESDRAAAIGLAVAEAGPSDVVLIAGKGHEDYQDINGIKHPFSDLTVAAAALAGREVNA
ncbi:UDP-N-acetylmuramoyl-L-alanyl-D-glutamate--2,6-diaminopimelate ligase [Chitinimonas lacunae]|uniref:UDP-N-acetylmuramoyl-L-alanyl-D-glutamate--2,6-diaminopimelate ligase n=1 Tax=Chitinimonas lacunae TaxID=1963018 RepID=A0ABV8MRM4_9NEIS